MDAAQPEAAPPKGPLIVRLTQPRRLLLALSLIFLAIVVAQVKAVAQRDGLFYQGGDVPIGADFYAFYSAGRIVAAGDGGQLYDLVRQGAEQAQVLKRDDYEGFVPFPYPAFVAVPYALLAQAPFLAAYALITVLMLAGVLAAISLLRRVSPTVQARPVLVALAVLASQPLAATIFGGQTVAFSLLCLAGSYAALRQERDIAAGVWLGLLLYKPQLAVLLLALLLWKKRWRVVAVAMGVGFGLALLGAVVSGPAWPWRFLNLANGTYAEMEATENGSNMISLLGVAEQVFGAQSVWAQGLAGGLGLGAVGLVCYAWRRARPDGRDFPLQFGLVVVATLLISPHALFYEASLLALPLIALVDRWRADNRALGREGLDPRQRLVLVGLWTAGYAWSFGAVIGIQPLMVLPWVVGALVWQALRRGEVGMPAADRRLMPVDPDPLGRITYAPRRESAHDGGVGTA